MPCTDYTVHAHGWAAKKTNILSPLFLFRYFQRARRHSLKKRIDNRPEHKRHCEYETQENSAGPCSSRTVKSCFVCTNCFHLDENADTIFVFNILPCKILIKFILINKWHPELGRVVQNLINDSHVVPIVPPFPIFRLTPFGCELGGLAASICQNENRQGQWSISEDNSWLSHVTERLQVSYLSHCKRIRKGRGQWCADFVWDVSYQETDCFAFNYKRANTIIVIHQKFLFPPNTESFVPCQAQILQDYSPVTVSLCEGLGKIFAQRWGEIAHKQCCSWDSIQTVGWFERKNHRDFKARASGRGQISLMRQCEVKQNTPYAAMEAGTNLINQTLAEAWTSRTGSDQIWTRGHQITTSETKSRNTQLRNSVSMTCQITKCSQNWRDTFPIFFGFVQMFNASQHRKALSFYCKAFLSSFRFVLHFLQ